VVPVELRRKAAPQSSSGSGVNRPTARTLLILQPVARLNPQDQRDRAGPGL